MPHVVGPSLGEEIINRWGFPWLVNSALICLVISLILILITKELPREELEEDLTPGGRQTDWKYATWLILLFIGLMPVVHGSVRGAMIYFMPLLVNSLNLGRVGPFFIVFSVAILSRFRFGGISDQYGRQDRFFFRLC